MTTSYGITSSGFVVKPRATVYSELCTAAIAASGDPNLDVSADSDLGAILGVLADALGSQWETQEGSYQESYPDGATGVPLENLCALTGIIRLPATSSEVDVTLTGTVGVTVSSGTLFDQGDATPQVALIADATIGGGGTVIARCRATETGPTYFLSGTVTRIVTPVAGLTSVTNALDQVVLGSDIEPYEDLRLRRETTLRLLGGSSVDAIRAHVSLVDGVTECFVLNNDEDVVVDTMPAHSFEVVVRGGTDFDIGTSILAVKPVGVYCAGSTSIDVYDAVGTTRTVRLTRPAATNIYMDIEVETWGAVPTGLADTIKAAIVATESDYHTGNDVYSSKFVRPIFNTSTTIQNVKHVYISTSPTPTLPNTITIGSRNYADFDTSRITVTITPLASI